MSKPSEQKQPRILDEAKLQLMSPPLSLYVTKMYAAGRTTPLTMPPKGMQQGVGPGQGYEAEDVKSISELLKRLGGGGNYRVQVTDSVGAKLDFDVWLNPQSYPDLIPPDLIAPSPIPQAPQQQQAPAPVIPIGYGASGGGPPDWFNQAPAGAIRQPPQQWQPQTVAAPAQAQPSYGPPGFGPPPAPWGQQPWGPMAGNPGWGGQWGSEPRRDRDREESRGERERERERERDREREREREKEAQRLREEAIKRDADYKLERITANHDRELAALREDIRRASEHPKENSAEVALLRDALNQLREENRALRDEVRQAQREGGKSSDMAAIMNMIVQMQTQSTAQFNQLLPLLMDKGGDEDGGKAIGLVLESMKQSQEAMRTIFSAVTEQARDRERAAAASAMTPKDMLDMSQKLRETSGTDQLLRSVNDIVLPMMRSVMQLQKENQGPGESPLAGLLGEAIQKAGDVAEKIVTGRRDIAVSENRVREVETHAQVVQAHAAAQGAVAPAPATPAAATSAAPAEAQGDLTVVGADADTVRRFGPLAEQVTRLRDAVKHGQVPPGTVFGGITQARNMVQSNGWKVPAIALLEQEQVAEFVDVLVPAAPQEWKRELMRWFHAKGDPGPSSVNAPPVAAAPPPAKPAQVIPMPVVAAPRVEDEDDEIPDGTPCTCGHVVEEHDEDEDDPGRCREKGCGCKAFEEAEGPAAS